MPLRMGTSGWPYRGWRGVLYPQGLPQKAWLAHYSHRFHSVEVNNAFYRTSGAAVRNAELLQRLVGDQVVDQDSELGYGTG